MAKLMQQHPREAQTRLSDGYMNEYDAIHIFFPNGPNNECNGFAGFSMDASRICTTSPFNNRIMAHELGHLIHKRLLDVDGSVTTGSCPTGYGWTTSSGEKCATAEGWANFVALATHWQSGGSTATYQNTTQNVEGYTLSGNAILNKCVSGTSTPERRIGNVTRFFWDAYDSNQVGDDFNDYLQLNFTSIRYRWDDFDDGTADRESRELGNNGRNVYDYLSHASWAQSYEDDLMFQNCLDNQTP